MNEKTMNQIAEMKKQTIGVEVEMNNITRQKAAKQSEHQTNENALPFGTDHRHLGSAEL